MFIVRPRKQWRAKPATSTTPQHPAQVHTLVVHHTAGGAKRTLLAAKRELLSIQRQHMAQGWSDIGYNYIIDRFGRVWEGRGLFRVGAHTLGHNTNTVGVSFMGNYENLKLNKRQIRAFRSLEKRLRERGVRFEQVRGHNQMPDQATACPGKHVTRQLGL